MTSRNTDDLRSLTLDLEQSEITRRCLGDIEASQGCARWRRLVDIEMADCERRHPSVAAEDVTSIDALTLINELSAVLDAAYGSSGQSSFDPFAEKDSVFLVARDGPALVGCGALRALPDHIGIGEIKRMYSRPGTSGVGQAILAALESEALKAGYRELWLETRRANDRAVRFYSEAGFVERAPYGKYVGRPEAICMTKVLSSEL